MFSFLLSFLLFTTSATPQELYVNPSRYYVEVETQEEAEQIAESINGTLISYVDGVAVYAINKPIHDFLRIFGVDAYSESESTVINGQEIVLSKDAVCFPSDLSDGGNPSYNEQLDPKPLESIGWENAYRNGITGKGAVVAVIDTGCNIFHEDLKDNIIGGYCSVDGSSVVTDFAGHGTHVTGTIVGMDNDVGNIGVAPDAKVFVIKASTTENGKTFFYHSDLVKALNKCIDLGYINVINMSLGGYGTTSAFKESMEKCRDSGITICVAAGNEATEEPTYPASYKIGLSVAAYVPGSDTLCYFSNIGCNANIAAPGANILSTMRLSTSSYGKMNGTSMASPHVAGVAALIYGNESIPKNRNGADYVTNKILKNADNITYSIKNMSFTGGVNIQNIFNCSEVRVPNQPKIKVVEQSDTGQYRVTIDSTYDVMYTLDSSRPTSDHGYKYDGEIVFDKSVTYKLRAVAVNKHSCSVLAKEKIKVPKDVVSQYQVENYYLYCDKSVIAKGKTAQVVALVPNDKQIPAQRIKWKSKTSAATIDKNGIVTVSSSASSGSKIKIVAKIGGVKQKLVLKVK